MGNDWRLFQSVADRRGVCALFTLVAFMSSATLSSAANEQPRRGRGPVQLVSPHDLTLITSGRFEFVVKARRGYRVHGVLDGRSVSLKRTRAGAFAREVSVRRLRPGQHVIAAVATRGSQHVSTAARFVVAGRRARLVSVSGPGHTQPLSVGLRLDSDHTHVRVFLNGRRIDRFFFLNGHRKRRAALGGTLGLRFGRNALAVTAFHEDGRWSRVVRHFTLTRARPLAAAGGDRVAVVGRRLTLDAHASSAGHRGRLVYRWAIIRRPRGSHARLRHANGPRPVLRTDKPGRYRVRLRVTERAQAGRRARVSRVTQSTDIATVYAQPALPPIGEEINAYDTSSGSPAITIGSTSYPIPADTFTIVALDPETLEPTVTNLYFGVFGLGTDLFKDLQAIPAGDIVVLATQGGVAPSVGPYGILGSDISLIGGESPPYQVTSYFSSTVAPFSMVGIAGSNQPQAYQFQNPVSAGSTYQPDVTGYITKASPTDASITGLYTFSPSQYVPYSIDGSTFKVGCTNQTSFCASQTPTVPSPGFGVAVFDAFTLTSVNSGGFADNAAGLTAMQTFLSKYSSDPTKLVMVASVGGPTPTTTGSSPNATQWGGVSAQIAALEGSGNQFNTFNQPNQQTNLDDYAFVGVQPGGYGSGVPAASIPPNTATWIGPVGQLKMNGVLARNSYWEFVPQTSGPLPVYTNTLDEIAYQPPTAFPFSQGQYHAAEVYMAQQLSCPQDQKGCIPWPSIRSQYAAQKLDWSDYATQLRSMPYPSGEQQFTEQQFDQLKNQLIGIEFPEVDRITALFSTDQLLQPFVTGDGLRIVNVQNIATSIGKLLPQAKTPAWASILSTIGDAIGIVGSTAGFFAGTRHGPGAPAGLAAVHRSAPGELTNASFIGALAGILSNAFNLTGQWVTDGSGNKLMSVIQDQASQITGDVAAATTQAQTAFENIRELTVSDYGKILKLYDLANNYLHWTDQHDIPSTAFTTLLTGANQLAWTGLMPTAFGASCSLGLLPSPNVQQFNQTLGFSASGSSISPAGRHWSTSAPSSLMYDISGPVSTDTSINGAMPPETFWEQNYIPQRESLSTNALCPPFTGSARRARHLR